MLASAFSGGLANQLFASPGRGYGGPVVVSTWNHGVQANAEAWQVLQNGGSALDAAERGVMVTEADPEITSVGYGGFPDRDGRVTLDACIMDHKSRCGSVAVLEHIKHPVAVARKVMEDTPHVMLAGEGALQFALAKGFKKEKLLTARAEKAWKKWLKKGEYRAVPNIENHDTIGLLVLDASGKLAGACTTSGMAWKMKGRIGDSPIIGAGLFVDSDAGAACATGVGEAVIRTAGSAMVVEMMRQGYEPEKACEEVVKRILKKHPDALREQLQVGFLALRKDGLWGGYSVLPGFNYAVYDSKVPNKMLDASCNTGK